ncbi:hypothetical protein EZV62_002565 [Acer yangbiense]|uniref:Dirigent protein n=1 Tax=Acer yangbiense TaxID=1000413 RepID=A0A5C7J011_9ROSI|nr:hypothetical protein EZV62_002565 [Acer yangbiense]
MGNTNLSSTSNSKAIKAILVVYLFLLVISLKCANSARILSDDEDSSPSPVPQPSNPFPTSVVPNVAPAVGPTTISTSATKAADPPILSFFMHDILGGTTPSGRVVSEIIASSTSPQINGLPFSKKKGGVFPISGGVTGVPLAIAGLNGATTNNGNSLPFVSTGQLPQGATLHKLIFGAITVIDDELTLEHELGSSIIGKAQGFYLASTLDGSSQTMAFTALFGEHEEDTISFFGVHRTATHESQVAVVGVSGKYENAQGHATIETLHLTDQHTTNGVETLLQISVYLTDH